MTMKLRVDSLDEVAEPFRGEYKPSGDGFVLDLEGDHEGEAAMRRARDHEKEAHKGTKAKLRELEQEMDEMRNQIADKTGSSESIHKSWQKKFDDKCAEYDGLIQGLNGSLSKVTVGSVAKEMSQIFVVPEFGEDKIRSRLVTEIVDGSPVVRVLDKDGNKSAMSLDELKQEFLARKDWAPILKGGDGSGGGVPPAGGKPKLPDDPSKWTEAQRAELLRTDPAKFRELFKRK